MITSFWKSFRHLKLSPELNPVYFSLKTPPAFCISINGLSSTRNSGTFCSSSYTPLSHQMSSYVMWKYFLTISAVLHQGLCVSLTFGPHHFFNCNCLIPPLPFWPHPPTLFSLTLLWLSWPLFPPTRQVSFPSQDLHLAVCSGCGYSSPGIGMSLFHFFHIFTEMLPSQQNFEDSTI